MSRKAIKEIFFCLFVFLQWLALARYLFIPLASSPGVPDRADDPRPSQWVVRKQTGTIGQVMAIWVGAGVRVGHRGDDSGLHHPLQVLACRDCIDCGNKGTVGAGHVNPVLLEREGKRW